MIVVAVLLTGFTVFKLARGSRPAAQPQSA
jgi:hypothetical protein